jgi:autotransporter passenger strand-loop-strand repeat protein
MTITVSSGVTSVGLTISHGDPLVVLSGGHVQGVDVLSGGSATLSSGGRSDDLVIYAGAVLSGSGELDGDTYVDGVIDGGTVGAYADLTLLSGGVASDVTDNGVTSFGDPGAALMTVDSGASATGTVVGGLDFYINDALPLLDVYGSAAHTVVESSGVEEVFSGGVAAEDVIESGGILELLSGGGVSDEKVRSGGAFALGGDLASAFTAGIVMSATVLSTVAS